jgi:hypothetical protein
MPSGIAAREPPATSLAKLYLTSKRPAGLDMCYPNKTGPTAMANRHKTLRAKEVHA